MVQETQRDGVHYFAQHRPEQVDQNNNNQQNIRKKAAGDKRIP